MHAVDAESQPHPARDPHPAPPTTRTLALFLPTLTGGGAERVMVTLAGGLAELGHDVELVVGTAQGPLVGEVAPDVRIVELHATNMLAAVLPLARYLRRRRPDALLATLRNANLAAVAARSLAGSPRVLVLREANTLSAPLRRRGSPKLAAYRRLMRALYPAATHVVANSAGSASDLADVTGLPRDRVEVIPNPVDVAGIESRAAAPASPAPPFGNGERAARLVAIGRLTEQKGFDVLIDAFADLAHRRAATLSILGEGEDRDALRARAERLGVGDRVWMPGFVANPYPHLRVAHAFVLASRWEGAPNVVSEALALGVPVVATDCPHGPRELLRGGDLGALVPVDDAPALAAAIERTLDAPPDPGPLRHAVHDQRAANVVRRYEGLLTPEGATPAPTERATPADGPTS